MLPVELLGEIGCRIEGRKHVVDEGKLVASEIAVATQSPVHLVQVAADLLESAFEAAEQAHEVWSLRNKSFDAELRHHLGVAVFGSPSSGDLLDAAFGTLPFFVAVRLNDLRHGLRC